MSIADQITRLINAKAAIKQSIVNKGVDVSDSALLDEYPALIDSISGGGGVDPFYKNFYNIRTNNGTNMSGLFAYCKSSELDLRNLDISKVTDMSYMFYGCSSSVNIDGWNTSQVTNMSNMFYLFAGSIDVSNFDTSKVTNMAYMFAYCRSLKTLDLSNWNVGNVTNMSYMFSNCDSSTSIDLSNWDTSKVTDMSQMFYFASKLTTVGDLSNWDVSNVTNISSMFYYCQKLASLDCSNWDISKVTSINTAFNYCTSLVDFKAPKNIGANMDVSSSKALSHDSLMSIINNLITTTSSKTLTLGATNLAKLTDEEKAIATNKGWKLA